MTSSATSSRALLPDLLRAFALIGIAVVNVGIFAWPFDEGYHAGGLTSPRDEWASFVVLALFTAKSYPLFSMMFGAGLAYQINSADRAGKAFRPRYFRRMGGLLFLGVLHFVFFFIGDILLTYAILGCCLYFMRDMDAKTLTITGAVLVGINTLFIALGAVTFWLVEVYAPEMMPKMMGDAATLGPEAIAAFTEESFWGAALYRLSLMPMFVPNVLFMQGIAALGFMMIGLAAANTGVISNAHAPIWKTCRLILLPIGLIGSAIGAWIMNTASTQISAQALGGMTLIFAFSLPASLGYAGVIAALSTGEPGPVRRVLARAGGTSLTAYLFQSLVMSLIFTGYGLGLFAQMPAFEAIMIGLGAAIASLMLTGLIRLVWGRGPMEFLLRRFTYWGRT